MLWAPSAPAAAGATHPAVRRGPGASGPGTGVVQSAGNAAPQPPIQPFHCTQGAGVPRTPTLSKTSNLLFFKEGRHRIPEGAEVISFAFFLPPLMFMIFDDHKKNFSVRFVCDLWFLTVDFQ